MGRFRLYGVEPFTVVAVHGGPGAVGDMAPVAKRIAEYQGCIETLHTACTVDDQVNELREAIESHAHAPVSLVGHSWGAWLVFIFAARYPSLVKKAILIGSGPFEARFAADIMQTRMNRLSEEEREEVRSLMQQFTAPSEASRHVLSRFGKLLAKVDMYDPVEVEEDVTVRSDVYEGVWPRASAMRESGELLKLAASIVCPVVAIHGDYDLHPAAGVREPLSKTVRQYEFILLKHCGHKPWIERRAQAQFHEILREQLKD